MAESKKKVKWDPQLLQTAIDKVLSKEMSLRKASMLYNIPRSTLHDKTSALSSGKEVSMQPKLGRFANTFLPEYEEVLVEHVKDQSRRCLPLMRKEFLKLAYDLAEEMKIPHRFNKEKGMAGKHFYYDFMKRHPDLSLRAPESTSMMRAVGFNKPQVDLFYDNLERLMTQYKFPPSSIYNCDETGVTCVHKHQKVLAPKAVRQVGKLTSAERGKNITVLFCMSANGHFIPPFFIYPRQRMNDRLMLNAPAESVGVAQPKGWMNSDFFLQWLHLFVDQSRPTKERPVLLLLDGHCSHKTLAVINFCREYNIHLLSSPPHTTHKLQPLDRTFMKPFKDAYNQQCDMWMRANAGARITDYDIAGLVNAAFTKVARLDIAVSGFKCTGIYPFDRNIFSDLDFLASEMTNIPLEEQGSSAAVDVLPIAGDTSADDNLPIIGSSSTTNDSVVADDSSTTDFITIPGSSSTTNSVPVAGTSSTTDDSLVGGIFTKNDSAVNSGTSVTNELPRGYADIVQVVHKLSPLPDAAKKRSAIRKRKCEKSEILTSSPYKNTVEEKENEKIAKTKKKEVGNKFKITMQENEKGKRKGKGKGKGKSSDTSKNRGPVVEISGNEKTSCVVCLEDFDEDWIQCSSCNGWAHEACADIPECSDGYICDRCIKI